MPDVDLDSRKSVFFYTLHKCASTLFGSYVLKRAKGLTQVNYAGEIFRGRTPTEISFSERGHIYGPLRVSSDMERELYETLIRPVTSADFVRDKIAIFLVRDPRDIIVSWFYSLAYSHAISPSPEIADLQHKMRQEVQDDGIDNFAVKWGDKMLRYFQIIDQLIAASGQSVLLRYEDMIANWDKFAADLTSLLEFDDKVLEQIYQRSRPTTAENPGAHRRSGKLAGYNEKLSASTIAHLNEKLAPVLPRFGYDL